MAAAESSPAGIGEKNRCSPPICSISSPPPSTRSALRFETGSGDETRQLGHYLAQILPATGVVLLIGDLGAGKTTLVKGIAAGRGAAREEDVASPTFTLIHEYGDPASIYHVDLYRLDTLEQARRLGLEDLFEQSALTLIEWGDRFPELFPAGSMEIRIRHAGDDRRQVEVTGLPG